MTDTRTATGPGWFRRLTAAGLVVMLVAACGGAAPTTAPTQAPGSPTPAVTAEPTPTPPPITIRIAHINQPTVQAHLSVTEVAQRIEERTNGAIRFELYPAGQLGTTDEVLQQASSGEPVIGYTDAAYLGTFGVPEMGVLAGPFLVKDSAEADRLAKSGLVQGWADELAEKAGIRVLALNWFDGPRHMLGVEKAFPTPADLVGVKVRIPPIKTWEETFKPLGAVPVTVQASELYSALQQRVVDASEAPIAGIWGNKWYEVAKVVTLTAHFNLFLGWAMSEEVYQSLQPEHRQILIEEFLTGGVENTEASKAAEQDLIDTMRTQHGVSFSEADIPAYQEATKPFYSAFPEWPSDLLDRVRSAIGG